MKYSDQQRIQLGFALMGRQQGIFFTEIRVAIWQLAFEIWQPLSE